MIKNKNIIISSHHMLFWPKYFWYAVFIEHVKIAAVLRMYNNVLSGGNSYKNLRVYHTYAHSKKLSLFITLSVQKSNKK